MDNKPNNYINFKRDYDYCYSLIDRRFNELQHIYETLEDQHFQAIQDKRDKSDIQKLQYKRDLAYIEYNNMKDTKKNFAIFTGKEYKDDIDHSKIR